MERSIYVSPFKEKGRSTLGNKSVAAVTTVEDVKVREGGEWEVRRE
jgi:hypothetical protein